MAFRRIRRIRKGRTFRRGPPLARVRRTWFESLNIDPCEALVVPFCTPNDGCCTTLWKMVLLDKLALESQFNDRASVKRILGDLWLTVDPSLQNATSFGDQFNRLSQAFAHMFIGLRRGEQDQTDTTLSPDIWANADMLADGQWMKTWQHIWNPFDQYVLHTGTNSAPINVNLNIPVGTDDTHTHILGVELCNTLSAGSGDICIETDHSVDCVPCPQEFPAAAFNWATNDIGTPRLWHVHFDIRKSIPMRENQELYMMFNGRSQTQFTDFNFLMYGNFRTLVQMG